MSTASATSIVWTSAVGLTPDDEWLWGKGRGYSLGRWAFWKERFGETATTQGLLDSVKDLAGVGGGGAVSDDG